MVSTVFKNSSSVESGALPEPQKTLRGMISRAEEKEFVLRYQGTKDQAAFNALHATCTKSIEHEVKRRKGYRDIDADDLRQQGDMGFLKALGRYNPDDDRGARLHTYALWYIKTEMDDFIMKNTGPVKSVTSKPQRKLFFNLRKTLQEVAPGKRYPSSGDVAVVAEKLGVPVQDAHEMVERIIGGSRVSISGLGEFGLATELDDCLHDADDEGRRQDVLLNALSGLNDRERYIIEEMCPDDDSKRATLQELGDHFGVSLQRIAQIKGEAEKKLKRFADDSGYSQASDAPHSGSLVVVREFDLS